MHSATQNLHKSLFENDPEERIRLITKACSIISQTIPYPEKISQVTHNKELLKNLILTYPLNNQIVRSLIMAIIEHGRLTKPFFEATKSAIEYIAVIKDEVEEEIPNFIDLQQNLMGYKSKSFRYCREILLSMGAIKLLCLNILEKLIERIRLHREFELPVNDLIKLLKVFVYYTKRAPIISTSLFIYRELDKELNDDFERIEHDSDFSDLMAIKHHYLKIYDENQEVLNNELNLGVFETSKKSRTKPFSSTKNITQNSAESSKLPSLTSFADSSKNIVSSDVERSSERRFKLITILENYVCEVGIPTLKNESNFTHFFRNQTNCEEMLEFILTPFKKPLLRKWESVYGVDIEKGYYNLDSIPDNHQINAMFKDIELDFVSSDILLHFLRGHKFIQALTLPENLNFIINSSPFILDWICILLSLTRLLVDRIHTLILKESSADFINYNLVADLIIEISKKQANYVANAVMNLNLLLVFLDSIDYPRACDLLQIFICPFHPEKELNAQISISIWKYLKCMDFFDLLCVKLLNDTKFDKRIFSYDNKPYDRSLIKITQPDLITSKGRTIAPPTTKEEMEKKNQMLIEEKLILKNDIDRIMGLIEDAKKGKDLKELVKMKKVSKNFAKGRTNYSIYDLLFGVYKDDYNPISPARKLKRSENITGNITDRYSELISTNHPKTGSEPKKAINNSTSRSISSYKDFKEMSLKRNKELNKKQFLTNEKLVHPLLESSVNMERLSSLYPSGRIIFQPQEIDFIEIDEDQVFETEEVNHRILNLLESIIDSVEFFSRRDKTMYPKVITNTPLDLRSLISAMFDFGDGGILKMLMHHYLSKLFITHHLDESTSFRAGKLVNRIIEMSLDEKGYLFVYSKTFLRVVKMVLEHLMKALVNLYILNDDKMLDCKNMRVTSHRAKLIHCCLKTFFLCLKLDFREEYKILDKVYVTVWHCIVMFFFLKGTNNTILNLCYKIFELVMTKGSKHAIVMLIFKFNFFSLAVDLAKEVEPSEGTKSSNYDSLISTLKKICRLINGQIKIRKELANIKRSIFATPSWFVLNQLVRETDPNFPTFTSENTSTESMGLSMSRTSKQSLVHPKSKFNKL